MAAFAVVEVWLTQSKMLLAARSAMKRFPLATLIRLYELLKNSRSTCEQSRSQQQSSLANSPSRFGVDLEHAFDCLWWRMTGSNRRPPACKAGALPAELIPRGVAIARRMVGLVGLEPTTPALSRRCSNQLSYRPRPVARASNTSLATSSNNR